MANSIMYQEDGYVVLEPDQPEQFLCEAELLAKLQTLLEQQTDLPPYLKKFPSPQAQARHLLETACEWDIAPGQYLQWYVVRLEK
ncbi:chlororespiratory reduction protein 7 [Spirulina subsalsa]|uniref:chlororespiratory reduction protein 7 n=1 Tax=Spirulina subsalsa TaxID=54311 RepID=UPI0002F9DE4D|nr:chlororespiratory reduction protein 7 [Spirulina subsalsa]